MSQLRQTNIFAEEEDKLIRGNSRMSLSKIESKQSNSMIPEEPEENKEDVSMKA